MVMLRFFRELRGYIARPNEIAAVRSERLKFSFFVQLHILVAFLLTLSMTGNVVTGVRALADQAMKLPAGVEFSKTGADLSITGLAQPFSFGEAGDVVTIDTTGATAERPASSTIFIGKTFIEMAPTENQAGQRMLWSEGEDFAIKLDQFKKAFSEQEAAIVTIFTLVLFSYFVLSSLVFSFLLVVTWSVLATIATRIIRGWKPMVFREVLAIHLVAISGPVLLWALFVASNAGAATAVEVFSFVVYSVLGLYAAQGVFDPPGASEKTDKPDTQEK